MTDLPKNKTILLTGGAGYVGLHTLYALQDAGYRPVIVDNLARGRRDLVPADIDLHAIDINDTVSLTELCLAIRPQAIIHLAALLSVEESTRIPLDYYHVNVSGTVSVCRAMVAAQVPHLVFSSTCCVYGHIDGHVDETAPLNPYSPYGVSKMMAERVIADAAQVHGFSYSMLRYFNVAGADPLLRAGPYTDQPVLLTDRICQAVHQDIPHLTVNGTDYATPDGTAVRDYVHVSDIAQAHVQVLSYLQQGGMSQIFNCGYGQGLSVQDMVLAAKRISQVDFPVHYGPRRAGDVAAIAADCSQIKALTGWQPQRDTVEDMLGDALSWYAKAGPRQG